MAKFFTRVQNEKLVAAQKDLTSSITNSINALYQNAYAVQMSTSGDITYITFSIQNEDGSTKNVSIKFSAILFNVGNDE
jgi:VCBS repeat-containing protein